MSLNINQIVGMRDDFVNATFMEKKLLFFPKMLTKTISSKIQYTILN